MPASESPEPVCDCHPIWKRGLCKGDLLKGLGRRYCWSIQWADLHRWKESKQADERMRQAEGDGRCCTAGLEEGKGLEPAQAGGLWELERAGKWSPPASSCLGRGSAAAHSSCFTDLATTGPAVRLGKGHPTCAPIAQNWGLLSLQGVPVLSGKWLLTGHHHLST